MMSAGARELLENYEKTIKELAEEKRLLNIGIADLYRNEGYGRLRSDHVEAYIKSDFSAEYEKIAILEGKLRILDMTLRILELEKGANANIPKGF